MKIWKKKVTAWNALDQEYLEKVLKYSSVNEFQAAFVDWIFHKHQSLRNWSVDGVPKMKKSSANGESTSLRHLPKTELSQKSMSLLIQHCFVNPSKFWPRAVIEYLIGTGNVSSKMVNLYIKTLLDLKELDLIQYSMEHVLDLSEKDYVSILKFVSNSENAQLFDEWATKKDNEYQEKIQQKNPHRVARSAATIMKKNAPQSQPSQFGISLNSGQKQFLYYCFSYPYIHSEMSNELVALDVSQLHVIFEWIRNIVAPVFDTDLSNRTPNQKFPLWWLWYDTPFESEYKELQDLEFKMYDTVC
jgi:hypothetical protein